MYDTHSCHKISAFCCFNSKLLVVEKVTVDCTLCDGSQFVLLLWAELQHGVDDGQQRLPLAAWAQEDELQQDVLQVLQVGHALLPLLVTLKTTHLALQQLGSNTRQDRSLTKPSAVAKTHHLTSLATKPSYQMKCKESWLAIMQQSLSKTVNTGCDHFFLLFFCYFLDV